MFVTPLCILAVVGLLWKMKAMKNSAILVASAIQMTQTIYFFVEPFKLEVNPIPTTGRQVSIPQKDNCQCSNNVVSYQTQNFTPKF